MSLGHRIGTNRKFLNFVTNERETAVRYTIFKSICEWNLIKHGHILSENGKFGSWV